MDPPAGIVRKVGQLPTTVPRLSLGTVLSPTASVMADLRLSAYRHRNSFRSRRPMTQATVSPRAERTTIPAINASVS
jgi:hypothetical protein